MVRLIDTFWTSGFELLRENRSLEPVWCPIKSFRYLSSRTHVGNLAEIFIVGRRTFCFYYVIDYRSSLELALNSWRKRPVFQHLSRIVLDNRSINRELNRTHSSLVVLCCASRHSTFGGTFVVANVKSISDRNLIYHNSLKAVNNIEFDRHKTARKRPKNRRPIVDANITRRSTLSIRLYLREFCLQFLDNCYNPLMRAVKVCYWHCIDCCLIWFN